MGKNGFACKKDLKGKGEDSLGEVFAIEAQGPKLRFPSTHI